MGLMKILRRHLLLVACVQTVRTHMLQCESRQADHMSRKMKQEEKAHHNLNEYNQSDVVFWQEIRLLMLGLDNAGRPLCMDSCN